MVLLMLDLVKRVALVIVDATHFIILAVYLMLV